MSEKLADKYEKILNFDYNGVRYHTPMPREKRAAQFAPFAALEGHMPLMREQERYVEPKHILDDDEMTSLNEKILILTEYLEEQPEVELCYFVPDRSKKGGKYASCKVRVRFVDTVHKFIRADNGQKYKFDDIRSIQGQIFDEIQGTF